MTDELTLKQYLTALKTMDSSEMANSVQGVLQSDINSSISLIDRSTNTRNAVNALLQQLLGEGAVEAIRANTRKNNTTPAIPTYNARTPIVEITINGYPIFPNAEDENRAHFEQLEVSFPVGGVEDTVRASVRLFAKDPGLIIQALDKSNDAYNTDSTSGLPLLKMRWGWAFATQKDATIGKNVREVWTPYINFLIMDVDISNIETNGTTFTFRLQDIGNTVLQYSAANLVFEPDYPQQQIRRIVEGCLGFRLFTLDDILNLKAIASGNPASTNVESANAPDTKTFFVNNKLGALRTHGNNFLVLLNKLATQCKCKWYSTVNSQLAQAIGNSEVASGNLDRAQQNLAQLKASGTATTEELTQAQTQIDQYFSDISFGCKLYWIDNVPEDWPTTSGTNYIKDTPERGAFFLLPDLADTTADALGYMDLNYGPGASSFPYLHGAAMNVFNASLAAAGQTSQTFGDVVGATIKYGPFISLLKSSISADAMYVQDNKYIASNEKGNVHRVSISKSEPVAATETQKAAAKAIVDNANANKTSESAKKVIRKTFRFYNVIPKKNYAEIVDAPEVQNDPIQKQFYNIADGGTYTAMKLRSRINQFLKYSFTISLSVLGDPTLIRLNLGGFELLSYYPSQDGKYQKLNPLTSGIYNVTGITHTLTMTDYTTTLTGIKNKDAKSVDSTLITKLLAQNTEDSATANASAKAGGKVVDNTTTTTSDTITKAAIQVDLTDSSFTKGFLSESLQALYKRQQSQNSTGTTASSGSSNPK